MASQRVYFNNQTGIRLAGILDLPESAPVSYALFSHCFTCTKDLKAIVRISRGLARHGIGVLRFDFTGLGDSQGDFSQTNFETNLGDVRAASQWLKENHGPAELLMGLSLGGAAMMAASSSIESAKLLATLAAPSCTKHLAEFLSGENPAILSEGVGQVVIGGRTHQLRRQLIENLKSFDLESCISSIQIPHLIIHSPEDETLAYRHALEIFDRTGGSKSMITLDGADHLMVNQSADVNYVADMIATWAKRNLT